MVIAVPIGIAFPVQFYQVNHASLADIRRTPCSLTWLSHVASQKRSDMKLANVMIPDTRAWSWSMVFWPWWFLLALCTLVVLVAGLYPCCSTATEAQKLLASRLRTYNLGFMLLLSVPLSYALHLDGTIPPGITVLFPSLAVVAAAGLHFMHQSR